MQYLLTSYSSSPKEASRIRLCFGKQNIKEKVKCGTFQFVFHIAVQQPQTTLATPVVRSWIISSTICSVYQVANNVAASIIYWRSLLLHLAPTLILTPYSRVLLQKLTGFQIVNKFPTFYATRRFIATFTSARYLSLSWANSIQSIPPKSHSVKIHLNWV
jgi:hypothetical protein